MKNLSLQERLLRIEIRKILDPKLSIHIDKDTIGLEYRVKKICKFINKNYYLKEHYPHAFGCEKFDDGECNCGYEKS